MGCVLFVVMLEVLFVTRVLAWCGMGGFSYPSTDEMPPDLLFDTEAISEALRSSGHDTSRLATPFAPKPSGLGMQIDQ